ncbi:hypothetical protein BD310DRAFT_65970 [Dichomitus squalens]|uniref:Uncharacterized protein n=1 Tax=Dichomitus squalens TaxID=114155 RepID=A0A4Q9PKA3_9APHY|nr:hypothetical protein BD310DRAFT_65970 [Dichomitus squalens]
MRSCRRRCGTGWWAPGILRRTRTGCHRRLYSDLLCGGYGRQQATTSCIHSLASIVFARHARKWTTAPVLGRPSGCPTTRTVSLRHQQPSSVSSLRATGFDHGKIEKIEKIKQFMHSRFCSPVFYKLCIIPIAASTRPHELEWRA